MKAAWICRACSRRLQASQTPRSGFQFPATQRSSPNRRYTSEASVANSATLDQNPRSVVSSTVKPSRFAQASVEPPTPDPEHRSLDGEDRQPAEDPFEVAFRTRRHRDMGKRRGKSRKPSETLALALGDLEPRQLPTIPEDLTTLEIPHDRWGRFCYEIRSGAKPKWLLRDNVTWLAELKSGDIPDLWIRMSEGQRKQLWKHLILTKLLKHPEEVPRILVATLMEPLPFRKPMNDVLHIILRSLQQATIADKTRRIMLKDIHHVILHYIKTNNSPKAPIRPQTLGSFAKLFTPDQVSELYRNMKALGTPLTLDTELHFASKLGGLRASDNHREEALEIFQGIVSRGENLMDPKVASVITSLLHQKSTGEKSSFAPLQVLQYFMENGFLPNAITLTAVIETLCERIDFPEAMHIVNLFSRSGLKLDAKGYDVLLKGARLTGDDGQMEEALEYCKRAGAPQSLLSKHAIHAIYSSVQSEVRGAASLRPSNSLLAVNKTQQLLADRPRSAQENQEAFIAMLRFYTKRFELGPLQSLVPQTLPYLVWNETDSAETQSGAYKATLLPALDQNIPVPEKLPLSPCSETLALVLRAYVKSLWRPYDLMSMYSFFKGRLRDPAGEGIAISEIVKTQGSLIHDSFILAMMQTHALVRPALEVFGDMLKDNFRDSESGIHPPPSVHTFGIILAGLGRHKENKLFDNLKQIMAEHGFAPNMVITNTLIKNYALRQDVGLTVEALRDLETLGFRPDQFTFDGFAKLRDQTQALGLMSRIIDENKRRSLE